MYSCTDTHTHTHTISSYLVVYLLNNGIAAIKYMGFLNFINMLSPGYELGPTLHSHDCCDVCASLPTITPRECAPHFWPFTGLADEKQHLCSVFYTFRCQVHLTELQFLVLNGLLSLELVWLFSYT